MVARVVAGAIAFLILAAIVFAGVACAALAIDIALTPHLGPAWAAALTALILLMIPTLAWAIVTIRRAFTAQRRAEEALLGALALFMKESPMIALVGAGLFGVASVLLKRWKRKP
jgi:hypothetical protein